MLSAHCLQRYDGYRFVNFYPGQGILPAGTIQAMHLDRQNRIWLCFQTLQTGYLSLADLSWHPVSLEAPPDAKGLEPSFFEKHDGNMLLFLKGEAMLTLGNQGKTFAQKFNAFQPPKGWRPISYWEDAAGNAWLSASAGLLKFNPHTRQLSYKGHNADSDAYIQMSENLETINDFFIDKKGIGWVLAWPESGFRYCSLDTATREIKEWQDFLIQGVEGKYFTMQQALEIGSEVWRFGENLLAKTDARGHFTFFPSGQTGGQQIRYDVVANLFPDREGNIWIATNNGLYRYAPTNPFLANYPNRRSHTGRNFYNDVTDFLEIAPNELWVSTWGEGIFAYDRHMQPLHPPALDQIQKQVYGMVWSLAKTPDGHIWWGEQNGNLGHYDPQKKKASKLKPDPVRGATIRQLAVDKQGRLWLGTQAGSILCYDIQNNQWTEVAKAANYIARLMVTPANEVWAGTFFDGIYRIDANSLQVKKHYMPDLPAGKNPGAYALDFSLYQDSLLLVATEGLRALNLRTGKVTTYLPLTGISNLAIDKDGFIWAGGGGGLHLFSLAAGKPLFHFDENSGLANVTFSEAATEILSDGRILFGNNHGFTVFDPQGLKKSRTRTLPPTVLLSELWVNEAQLPADSVQQLSVLKLGPGNFTLKLRYTTNTFQYPDTIYYKISGLEKNWRPLPAGNELSINYPGPGDYLITTAVQQPGGGMLPAHTLRLVVQPPFYRTPWFFFLMALALLLAFYLLDRYRLKRQEEVLLLRRKIAGQLHNDISNTLEKINILSDIAILKHTTDPVKSREFISEIKSRSAVMMSALQDMLWSIAPEHDSAAHLIARLEQSVQHAGNRYPYGIEFAAAEKTRHIKLDMQLRYDLLLLFKTMLNSLMEAGARNIYTYIECEKNKLNFIYQFVPGNGDEREIINFLSGNKLLRKLSQLQADVVSALGAQAAEIIIKIPLRPKK